MQNKQPYGRLYSASDLVAYLGCHHRTELDLKKLYGWEVNRTDTDESVKLLQDYGDRHERAYLETLIAKGLNVAEVDKNADLDVQLRTTKEAMQSGADIIFQATLLQPPFIGYADFLLKVPGNSKLGDFHYEVIDTKLAKTGRVKFVMQLCLYAEMVAQIQGVMPENIHIVLGNLDTLELIAKGLEPNSMNISKLRTSDYMDYFQSSRKQFLSFIFKLEQNPPTISTLPEPVKACGLCGWIEHCESYWERVDHLSRVANIRKDQINKLFSSGVTTMHQLSQLNKPVPGISDPVRIRLQKQAELQVNPEKNSKLRIEYLEQPENKIVGLGLLPQPDQGDLYFDMEGFPYEVGGLEYLFGLGWVQSNTINQFDFTAFWAHDRAAEKIAFEKFMDFVKVHLQKHPKAHIYHYASYEKTAIQRLSSIHNTRTEFRDQLLREGRLVDLYRVVLSGLQLALPSYSIKYVEKYYRDARQGDVVNAGASIVMYEEFRGLQDKVAKEVLLRKIEKYNYDDVESTWKLHLWLESLRPQSLPYFVHEAISEEDQVKLQQAKEERDTTTEIALARINQWFYAQPDSKKESALEVAELLRQITGFYWRCKLPSLWRKFQRQENSEYELLDDMDCLALLESTGKTEVEKRSIRYFYQVPDQESKISSGSDVICLTDGSTAGKFEYDLESSIASFTRGAGKEAPPKLLSLMMNDNVSSEKKQEAIYRFIAELAENPLQENALLDILMLHLPRLKGRSQGTPIVNHSTVDELIRAVQEMDNSYLVIQGPPGTGKSTNASKAIAQLIKAGKKIGITSNSHAAINHLLKASLKEIKAEGIYTTLAVAKQDESLPEEILVLDSNEINSNTHSLIGGTSWLFSRIEQKGAWDYLFVDEASQVSLADLVASGSSAKNIVLLGDQMQLPQPVEGIHPGKSGLSALDYLMQGHATVPKEMGIFLERTYRMHPLICKPISDGVYEGRLQTVDDCANQKLILTTNADPALKASGISYVPLAHEGRSQSSPEESQRIKKIYTSLLKQTWVDRAGTSRSITPQDILIVAPYYAQIKELKRVVGSDARVGTVDKFQGQEAAIAIYSMTSSNQESIPRGLDFLFSKNRLNVGVSRAKCLAIIVASFQLETIECEKIEDMTLLNFYIKLIQHGIN